MNVLPRIAMARPVLTILAGVVVVVLAGLGLPRLEIRTDGHSLVPAERPEIETDRGIRERFDLRDQIAIMVSTDDPAGIFTESTLRFIADLTTRVQGIEGIRPGDVMSLATERGDRVRQGTLDFRTLLDPMPSTQEELDRLRGDLQAIRIYDGTIVASDGHAAAIIVGIPEEHDRTDLYRRIVDEVSAGGERAETVAVVGGPVAETLLGSHLLDDLGVPAWIISPEVPRGEIPPDAGAIYRLRVLVARSVGLLPVAVVVMALVFLAGFRRLGAVFLPLLEVAACLVFVFGVMGWSGVPVYLTIAVMPVILTAVGLADEIHIFHRYREHARSWIGSGEGRAGLVARTMSEMSRPVVRTSVTTAIGFLSFMISPIGPVRVFGLFTALGVVFCLLWSLTVIPACLVLLPTGLFVPSSGAAPAPARRAGALRGLAGIVRRWRYAVIAAAAVVVVAAPFGAQGIVVQDSWIDGFAPDSAFYRATQSFNDRFLGAHILVVEVNAGDLRVSGEAPRDAFADTSLRLPLITAVDPERLVGGWVGLQGRYIPARQGSGGRNDPFGYEWLARIVSIEQDGNHHVVHTAPSGSSLRMAAAKRRSANVGYALQIRPLLQPPVVEALCGLEDVIAEATECAVGGVRGPCGYVETTNFLLAGRQEDRRVVPDSDMRLRRVWTEYERVRGPERLQNLVSESFGRTVVTVFLKDANFIATRALLERIRAYEREHLAPLGAAVEFGGDVAVSQTLIDAIVSTQVRSVIISLAAILIVTSLLGRSLVWGVCCVLPCGIAILLIFATMGLAGVPLSVSTSMFAAMTLGVGVDYAIHLLERYRFACEAGVAPPEAIADALGATGPAVLIDAVAVALGFSVLMLSEVPANDRLGGIVALSVLGCVAATLVLLPALLAVIPARLLGIRRASAA